MPRSRSQRKVTPDHSICAVCISPERTVLGPIFRVEFAYGRPTRSGKSELILSDLIKKIIHQQELGNLLQGVDHAELAIWKLNSPVSLSAFRASSSEGELEAVQKFIYNLDFDSKAERLHSMAERRKKIKDLFDSHSTSNNLHVIVELPSAFPKQVTPIARRDNILEQAEKDVRGVYPYTPSDIFKIRDTITGSRHLPSVCFSTGLYHPALAMLLHELPKNQAMTQSCDPQPITGNPSEGIRQFCMAIIQTRFDRKERWEKMRAFFCDIFGNEDLREIHLPSNATSQKKPKDIIVAWGNPPYAILTIIDQDEGGDANLLSAQAYLHEYNHLRGKQSLFPAILIGISGDVFQIFTAVSLPDSIVYHTILLADFGSDRYFHHSLPLVFQLDSALRKCAAALKEEWCRLPNSPVKRWYLPHPILHPSCETPDLKLTFKCALSHDNRELSEEEVIPEFSLFLATVDSEEVVVKFSFSYNTTAHRLLAEHSDSQPLVPKLHGLGCYQLMGCGDLQMVVMERVPGKPMSEFEKHSLPSTVFDDVKAAIDILQDQDLVFGDLRASNVMIVGEDKNHAMLVDFDSAGRHDQDKYPTYMYRKFKGGVLHQDAGTLCKVMKCHDDWALQKIINDYQKKVSVD